MFWEAASSISHFSATTDASTCLLAFSTMSSWLNKRAPYFFDKTEAQLSGHYRYMGTPGFGQPADQLCSTALSFSVTHWALHSLDFSIRVFSSLHIHFYSTLLRAYNGCDHFNNKLAEVIGCEYWLSDWIIIASALLHLGSASNTCRMASKDGTGQGEQVWEGDGN